MKKIWWPGPANSMSGLNLGVNGLFDPPEFFTGGHLRRYPAPRNPPPLPSPHLKMLKYLKKLPQVVEVRRIMHFGGTLRLIFSFRLAIDEHCGTPQITSLFAGDIAYLSHKTSNNSPRGPHPSAPCVHPGAGYPCYSSSAAGRQVSNTSNSRGEYCTGHIFLKVSNCFSTGIGKQSAKVEI